MGIAVGIRFRNNGKTYDFDPGDLSLLPGESVMVETSRGVECGEVVQAAHSVAVPEDRPLKPVLRRANAEDLQRVEENEKKEREAMRICQERIAAHGLEMKLVDAEYAFDNTKILFNFTAEGRVDFRDLVKDLAGVFHTRIELHQIGVRDEAKKLGGIGICGQPFCCSRFLNDFQPVSIKMAKEQGLSLNPTKISGSCGRLMCCLKYEQDTYEELNKLCPKVGATVTTPQGRGTVTEVSVLAGTVKVRLEQAPDSPPALMSVMDLGMNKRTETAPVAEPKPEVALEPVLEDTVPLEDSNAVAEPSETPSAAEKSNGERHDRNNRHRYRNRNNRRPHSNKEKQEN